MVVDETSSWQNDIAPVHYQNEKKNSEFSNFV